MKQMQYNRYVNSDELATILNVNVKTVRRLVASGDLPCVRLRRQMRFWLPDVIDSLNRKGGMINESADERSSDRDAE